MECFRLLFDHLPWIERQFLSGIRDSRKAGSLWGMMKGVGGVRKSEHQSWLAKELGLRLGCWGFKGVQEEIPSEEASTIQIGSVAFPPGQCISPQLHPYHRLFDQGGHQDSSSASLYSRPCSLWLLVILWAQRLSLWDNWGDERGYDEGHWHAYTRGLPWVLSEFVGMLQQMHCSRRRLLRRGLEFHVCIINKSAHTKKVWKLIVWSSYIRIEREKQVNICISWQADSQMHKETAKYSMNNNKRLNVGEHGKLKDVFNYVWSAWCEMYSFFFSLEKR